VRLASIKCRQFDRAAAQCRKRRDHGLLEGDRTADGSAPAMAEGRLFSAGPSGLCIARQNSRPAAILRWRSGPVALLRVQVRSARRLVIATKAAMGAADPAKDHLP